MVSKKSTQRWEPGQIVNAGFVRNLIVKAAIPTPGDHARDAYLLTNQACTQIYRFVPHNGLEKLSIEEARALIAEHEARTARAFERADELAETALAINNLFAKVA